MRTRRWPRFVAATLFFVLLVLNLYVFFNREWEVIILPSSYATLYYPLDVPTIREWKVAGRNNLELDIACHGQSEGVDRSHRRSGTPRTQPERIRFFALIRRSACSIPTGWFPFPRAPARI